MVSLMGFYLLDKTPMRSFSSEGEGRAREGGKERERGREGERGSGEGPMQTDKMAVITIDISSMAVVGRVMISHICSE